MSTALSSRSLWNSIEKSPWLVLIIGVVLALTIVTFAMILLMDPALEEVRDLAVTLGLTSLFSLAIGFFLYRRGWTRSPSLSLTLVLTYVWAAILTLLNVWIMARLMFIEPHDLTLAGILLVFAVIIATTFGIFVSASVTDSLRNLADSAQQLAQGNLTERAAVRGRDEIALVARSFNEMASQLELADQKRTEVENLRRDLIAWTSHDLRTPLTSIRVMIEALRDGLVEDEETRNRYYRTISMEVMALNRLIDDLFELAQLEAGGVLLTLDYQSLSDLVSDAIETFIPIAEKRSIIIDGKVHTNVDPVKMNASKISRVLDNLLQNAIQHTPDRGLVRLEVARQANGVEVNVIDNGSGFPIADLDRVFEKFYRVEPARSRATGGSGLGLAIAKGIVEAHEGKIWAANEESGGARVAFILPG